MAEAVLNDELEKGLKQARKKPRNFLLVGTGSKPLKLVVQKKPIKPADIADAKKEAKGTAAITGVCQGEGATMTFFVTEETSFKTVGLRVLIQEETGIALKPEFQVVTALPEVKEEEEEGSEQEGEDAAAQTKQPVVETKQSEVPTESPPPVPPPAPPPPPGGPQAALFTAALNKLAPAIQAAVIANPDKKLEILKPVAELKELIKAKEFDAAAAKELLGKISKSVTALSSTAPPVSPPSPQPTATTPPPDAGTKPTLEKVDSKAQDEFESLLSSLTDRYTEVLRGQPSTATQIRGVMDFANGKAELNDFTSGLTALKRLVGLLDQAEQELLAEAVDAQVDAEDEGRGVVAFRKALLNWEAARNSAVGKIRSLQAEIAKDYPDADVDRLSEIFEDDVDGSLNDALIDCINAEDAADRKHYSAEALKIIGKFKSAIDSSEVIQGVDSNPFQENFRLGDSLKKALDQVAAFLA